MEPPKAATPAGPVARVKLLGEDFALKGDDPGRLERLALDLNDRLSRLAADLNLRSQPSKTALLVALNLLDELDKSRTEYARLESGTTRAATAMVERIDATLAGEEPSLI